MRPVLVVHSQLNKQSYVSKSAGQISYRGYKLSPMVGTNIACAI